MVSRSGEGDGRSSFSGRPDGIGVIMIGDLEGTDSHNHMGSWSEKIQYPVLGVDLDRPVVIRVGVLPLGA
jgi:hypothetical protein